MGPRWRWTRSSWRDPPWDFSAGRRASLLPSSFPKSGWKKEEIVKFFTFRSLLLSIERYSYVGILIKLKTISTVEFNEGENCNSRWRVSLWGSSIDLSYKSRGGCLGRKGDGRRRLVGETGNRVKPGYTHVARLTTTQFVLRVYSELIGDGWTKTAHVSVRLAARHRHVKRVIVPHFCKI